MIFIHENFEFFMNLISMLLYVAAILEAYFVWSWLENSLKNRW